MPSLLLFTFPYGCQRDRHVSVEGVWEPDRGETYADFADLTSAEVADDEADLVHHLALLLLRARLHVRHDVQVQVRRDPDREPGVQPVAVLLPAARGDAVERHEEVRLGELDGLPAVEERGGGRVLGEVHRDRVDL